MLRLAPLGSVSRCLVRSVVLDVRPFFGFLATGG